MKLKEYIDKYGVKQTILARRAKICQQTLMRAIRGEYITYRTASKISKATEEQVTAFEILNDCFGCTMIDVITKNYTDTEKSSTTDTDENRDTSHKKQYEKKTRNTKQSKFGITPKCE